MDLIEIKFSNEVVIFRTARHEIHESSNDQEEGASVIEIDVCSGGTMTFVSNLWQINLIHENIFTSKTLPKTNLKFLVNFFSDLN